MVTEVRSQRGAAGSSTKGRKGRQLGGRAVLACLPQSGWCKPPTPCLEMISGELGETPVRGGRTDSFGVTRVRGHHRTLGDRRQGPGSAKRPPVVSVALGAATYLCLFHQENTRPSRA